MRFQERVSSLLKRSDWWKRSAPSAALLLVVWCPSEPLHAATRTTYVAERQCPRLIIRPGELGSAKHVQIGVEFDRTLTTSVGPLPGDEDAGGGVTRDRDGVNPIKRKQSFRLVPGRMGAGGAALPKGGSSYIQKPVEVLDAWKVPPMWRQGYVLQGILFRFHQPLKSNGRDRGYQRGSVAVVPDPEANCENAIGVNPGTKSVLHIFQYQPGTTKRGKSGGGGAFRSLGSPLGDTSLFLARFPQQVSRAPQSKSEESYCDPGQCRQRIGVSRGASSVQFESDERMIDRGRLLIESVVGLVVLIIAYAMLKPF